MGDIFGGIAAAIERRIREANAIAAEAQRAQADAQARAISRASGRSSGQPARIAQREVGTSAPSVAQAPSVGALARQAAAEFAALDELFAAPKTALHQPQVTGGSALLAAFRGGEPLLAAIVLSEALAPPVALRQPQR